LSSKITHSFGMCKPFQKEFKVAWLFFAKQARFVYLIFMQASTNRFSN